MRGIKKILSCKIQTILGSFARITGIWGPIDGDIATSPFSFGSCLPPEIRRSEIEEHFRTYVCVLDYIQCVGLNMNTYTREVYTYLSVTSPPATHCN